MKWFTESLFIIINEKRSRKYQFKSVYVNSCYLNVNEEIHDKSGESKFISSMKGGDICLIAIAIKNFLIIMFLGIFSTTEVN